MKTVGDLGEFDLIARIRARAASLSPTRRSREIVLGIGDDAAILRPRTGEDLVVTTDALVENTHFRWADQSARAIGRKALIVNLSDIAAMGARPVACTLALTASPALPIAHFDGFIRGFLEEALRHACPLVGGNISRSHEMQASVTVMGASRRGRALTRDGARPGDRLFVTGSLGGAALALVRAEHEGVRIRQLPEPRLAAGQGLARMRGVGACIDISDGLVADLGHLLTASGVGAEIDPSRVPRPRGLNAACERLGFDPDPICLQGGEDYELLFSMRATGSPRATSANLTRRLGVAVHEIGGVVAGAGITGIPHLAGQGGWRHF